MKVGSLFSGIGGLDLGLERAGMDIIWQVENDEFCRQVLQKHWPQVKLYGDVRDIDFTRVEPVDLICGGFPCQPVSVVGQRKGDKDERWLWPDFYRAICEARPRWVLVENVPGLLSAQDGRLFGGILRDLAASGYDAEWDLLPAAAFGAPHLRYRLFLVAHSKDIRWRGRHNGDEGRKGRTLQIKGPCSGNKSQILAHPTERQNIIGRPGNLDTETEGGEGGYAAIGNGGEDVADTDAIGRNGGARVFRAGRRGELANSSWWATEPDVGRVAHRIASRVDRLKGLGNAVVPQVAEWIGRRIMEADNRIKNEDEAHD